jgi:protein-disulfide isomerase
MLGLVGACVAPQAFAAPAALSKADVETIVKAYIQSHGEELSASIEAAQTRKQMALANGMIRADTPVKGPANAPVTIVEFMDIECPYCHGVQNSIKAVEARYGNKIRWAFKSLPLDFHKNARPAAYAAMAANKQGKAFEFVNEIFLQQDKLGEKLYVDTAKKLKLDMKKFNADRASAAVKAQVDRDLADAGLVEARGTPFFLINGQVVPGALPPEAFFKVIDAELAKTAKK